MVITPSTLDAAFINFDTRFQEVFKATPTYWDKLATRVPSNSKEQRHAWLKKLPQLREWIGPRQVNNLSVNLQALVNKKFEDTFAVDREDLEDDQIGVYMPAVEGLAEQARKWPDRMVIEALMTGEDNESHDGQNFFSASHPVNPDDASLSTQSNYDSSGKALSPTNYAAARAGMMSLKGEDGVPLEISPNLLVVPPQLETTARQILHAETIANAVGVNAAQSATNIFRGTAEVLVIPRLASEATTWYLLDTTRSIKPFIYQDRKAPEFTYLNKADDQDAFMQDKYYFGVRARGAAGYGPYYLAYKGVA